MASKNLERRGTSGDQWFIERSWMRTPLNFLDAKQKYVATIYRDAADAHWEKNPMAYTIENYLVNSKTTLKLKLASGGGAAVSITPAANDELKSVKKPKHQCLNQLHATIPGFAC
jgi:hypothetical protein